MTMRGENSAKDSSPMSPSRILYGEENLAHKRSTVKTGIWLGILMSIDNIWIAWLINTRHLEHTHAHVLIVCLK